MGDQLFVQPAALGAAGTLCATTGVELLAGAVTPTIASPAQATAIAVTTAHLAIGTATTLLAGHSAFTGTRLGEAATGFTAQDTTAAGRITAAAPTVLV